MDAFESDELVSDDEDAKHLEKTQKSAEQKDLKNKRKKAVAQRGGRGGGRKGSFSSTRTTLVPSQAGGSKPRQSEPCFNCLEMGHLKANCPNIPRQYPLNNNIVV